MSNGFFIASTAAWIVATMACAAAIALDTLSIFLPPLWKAAAMLPRPLVIFDKSSEIRAD